MINVFMLDIKKTNALIDLEIFEPNRCLGFWVLWNRVVTEKSFRDLCKKLNDVDNENFKPIICINDYNQIWINTFYEEISTSNLVQRIEDIKLNMKEIELYKVLDK